MTGFLKVIGLLTIVLHCNGFSARKQGDMRGDNDAVFRLKSGRRFEFPQGSVIIGAPSYPNHLPEAEAILPGHTLLRPGLGMLKSAVKFPHRELEGGSGVYGNWDNLGIRYDGKNERVLYSGFRRSNSKDPIVLYHPLEKKSHKAETKKDTKNEHVKKIIQEILNTEYRRRSSRKSKNEKENTRSDKGMHLSFGVQGPTLKKLNRAIDKTLKSWHLKDLVRTKNKYIKKIMKTINSLRRNKENDKKLNVKQYFKDKHEDRLDKQFFDQHKDFFSGIKVLPDTESDVDVDVDKNVVSASETEETIIGPNVNAAVTPGPTVKTREQLKQEWFWQTKDMGNHIKINQNALDFNDFLPKVPEDKDMEKIQSWWFFNQADYTKLHEK